MKDEKNPNEVKLINNYINIYLRTTITTITILQQEQLSTFSNDIQDY